VHSSRPKMKQTCHPPKAEFVTHPTKAVPDFAIFALIFHAIKYS